ncbi:MAG: hypothetical protein ACF8NJ_04865 [Phycisphaerales bacterium JB038]
MPDTSLVDGRFVRVTYALTALLTLLALAIAILDPDLYERMTRHDEIRGGGLVEHLTVVILGIAAVIGVVAVHRTWKQQCRKPMILWVAACTLGAVYFGGEEASWGQWYFGWATSKTFEEINRQGETNLHNISEWLSYKPKLLAQLFVIFAGWLVPWLQHLLGKTPSPGNLASWILAPRACWLAGAIFPLLWVLSSIDLPPVDGLGASEFREFWIAWFLTLYLASYLPRLKTPPPTPAPARP